MFPVSDVIPPRRRPDVTLALLAATAVAFVCELPLDDRRLNDVIRTWGVVPASFSWPTVFTGMFLHGGWLHAGANVVCLWLFGANVEDRLGRLRYALFYFAGGSVTALAYLAMRPDAVVPMIGASGPLAGVMGAYVVLYPQSRILTAVFALVFFDLVEVPAVFYVAGWVFLQLFIDVWSVGANVPAGALTVVPPTCAFVAGALTGAYLRFREQTLRGYWSVESSRAKIKI